MACSFASPASSFSLSGSEAPGNYTPRPMAPRPFDGGGNIFSYLSNARAANYSARRTVIAGVCASACTMKLSIRNACIEPDATLLFHQASYNGSRSELATRVMLFAYPRKIRDWVLRSGALNSTALTELSGRSAIAMGVRSC
ncbi:MAG: hypothetical protein P4M15_03835 [Alphaproteobacteria bacterium]|nr:hypothetical protein [Alphaproteobacteria bacterium]